MCGMMLMFRQLEERIMGELDVFKVYIEQGYIDYPGKIGRGPEGEDRKVP